MNIIIKHVLRNIKENKKRTFFMMISLIFVSMFISIIVSFSNLLVNLEQAIYNELKTGYEYIISNKDGSPITKAQEDAVLNGTTKISLFSDYGYAEIDNKEYFIDVYGVDTENSYKVGLFSKNNNSGIELKENEIIILEDELKHLNLKIGDKIIFNNSKGNSYELVIADTLKKENYLAYEKGKKYTFATNIETYKKITEQDNLEIKYYFITFDKKLNEKEKQQFKDKCEEIGIDLNENDESSNILSLFSELVPLLAIVILLLGVIVYFVNNSFVKIIINERIPVMGTFRSVGATSKKLDRILLLEMALYGFISGIIGSIIGFTISRLVVKNVLIPMYENIINGFNLSFFVKIIDNSVVSILLISIICVTIFQIVLSIKDILASNKISIKDCIFSKYNDLHIFEEKKLIIGLTFLIIGIITIILHSKINIFWGIISLILLFVSIAKLLPFIYKFIFKILKPKKSIYKMASSNIYNSKLQVGNSIILCILLSIIMLVISFANDMKEQYLNLDDKYNFDTYVNVLYSSDEDINDITFVDGIESVAILYNATLQGDEIYFANNKISNFTFLSTDNAETLLKTNKEYKNIDIETLKNLSKNEIIISSSDAKKYGINVGDYIYIKSVMKKKKFDLEFPIYFKVVGLHDYFAKSAFINNELTNELEKLEIALISKQLFIISEDNVDVTENINKIFKEREISDEAKTLSEFIEDKNSEMNSTYFTIVLICVLLSVIVLICLINNEKISFLQRKKELATLNSICMSKKQLKKMITIEIMISYLLSFVMAIIYSIILSYIISILLEGDLKITIFSAISIFIIMAIVMYLVSLKIRKNIDKINIVEEIKYE